MSKFAKICFLGAFLCLVVLAAFQVMAGGWVFFNYFLLGGAAVLIGVAIFKDIRLYWEFFTMRTTKHGMNMGVMILLTVTLLVCVNYLANKNNKTWDLTAERLNSLSEQTTKLLDGLKDDLLVKVFYKGPEAAEMRAKIKQSLTMYQEYSSKVKVQFVNMYVEDKMALEYMRGQNDLESAQVMVFFEHKGKKIRIDEFDESGLTAGIIKITREGATKVYFVQGHGEKDLSSDDDQGLMQFVKALKDSSFEAVPLNLLDKKDVPEDAAAIAIIGPSMPYLENEMQALRAYVARGGRVFMALDPGTRHNLANFAKTMGVEFSNNYIFSLLQIPGQGPATVVGRRFDPSSEVTKSIPTGTGYAVFPLASELKSAGEKTFEIKEIVKSDERSFTVTDPSKPVTTQPKTEAITIGLDVKGTVEPLTKDAKADSKDKKPEDSPKSESKPFQAVIFGDSDFVSNRALFIGVNRDLALNAFAELTNQKDLISIKPKLPKGTMVMLTQYSRLAIILILMALPVVLLVASGVMWFRRRGA